MNSPKLKTREISNKFKESNKTKQNKIFIRMVINKRIWYKYINYIIIYTYIYIQLFTSSNNYNMLITKYIQ